MLRHRLLFTVGLALVCCAGSAAARDRSGTYGLRALEGWRPVRVELVLQRLGADDARYAVTRTVRRGEASLTHRGEGLVVDGRLEVRLDVEHGIAGALSGARGVRHYHGTYRFAGSWLSGRVEAPGLGGEVVTSRELGRRRGAAPRVAGPPPAAAIARTPAQLGGRLRVVGRELQDPAGRTVLLRGVNAGLKREPFLAPHTAADVRRLVEKTGIDFVRYYVAWRAIEPEPLRYDAAYLDAAVEGIRRWTDAGCYVLVDMHQDVWGGSFAQHEDPGAAATHGAPLWASLGRDAGGLSFLDGLPWQARYLEPRVYESFEAFWSDATVPQTGLGLQEHYARAWAQLAGRLAGEERVVGYDFMNEPFMGREIKGGMLRLAAGSAGPVLGVSALSAIRALFRGREVGEEVTAGLVDHLRDPDRFDRVLARLEPAAHRFERRLAAFYRRMGRAVRAVDPERPIFVEPFALAGIGLRSGLPHPGLEQIVYAPHLYDAFMDSHLGYDGDPRRVERAFARHQAVAHRLGAPLVVGEWGNLPDASTSRGFARDAGRLFDEAGVGAAYWDHFPGYEDDPLFLAAMRPYVQRVAGTLQTSAFDPDARTLRVAYRPDPAAAAPTVIAAPAWAYPRGVTVRLSGAPAESEHDAARGVVLVWSQGGGPLTVEVAPAP